MCTTAQRRLMRDYKKLQEDPPYLVSGSPHPYNLLVWDALIFGPADSPFEDGNFRLTLYFTERYPDIPPFVQFRSEMFHPNIYNDGSICLDILQTKWSPTYDVSTILSSIQSLLGDPNPNSPANGVAAQLYKEDRREYDKRVNACVEKTFLNEE